MKNHMGRGSVSQIVLDRFLHRGVCEDQESLVHSWNVTFICPDLANHE